VQRELNYKLSPEQLPALAASVNRKVHGNLLGNRNLHWAVFLAVGSAASFYNAELSAWLRKVGLPVSQNAAVVLMVLFGATALWQMRRLQREQLKKRMASDPDVRMIQDEGGLQFGNATSEYYLKWQGIGQMLVEPGAVVILSGSTYWPIPDAAFQDAAGRWAFIQDVYGRLSEEAPSLSEKHVLPVLAG
jgi:hypothetical protein